MHITKKEMQTAVHTALKAWSRIDHRTDAFEKCLLVQAERRKLEGSSPTVRHLAINRVLSQGVTQLEQHDAVGADLLRKRFMDGLTMLQAAFQLELNEDQAKRKQRDAIQQLSQILWQQEKILYQTRTEKLLTQLPSPTANRLFGVDQLVPTLANHLLNPKAASILALAGLGGIGKTALATAIAYQAVQGCHFSHVLWLNVASASMNGRFATPEQTYDALLIDIYRQLWPDTNQGISPTLAAIQIRAAFQTTPHLVIIDNLEDEADVAYLLPKLQALSHPTRFLLTTRAITQGTTPVYIYMLKQLPLAVAIQLVRYQAERRGIAALAKAADAEFERIYAVVGGNPLALKLVASLTAVFPLTTILNDLQQTHFQQIETMYKHIYWQAWQSLSDAAQDILFLMCSISLAGTTPDHLQQVSQLPSHQFWSALTELVNRSLLEVRGDELNTRRYSCHALTLSFLKNDLVKSLENPR